MVSVDFYKDFELEQPISGLVRKVISSKGIRSKVGEGYSYKLTTEFCGIYGGSPMELTPGLYQVLDICKPYECPVWNHYLFIIGNDGKVMPVAEYLDQHNSEWIRSAIHVVKKVFSGEAVKPIKLTQYEHEEQEKTHWKNQKK